MVSHVCARLARTLCIALLAALCLPLAAAPLHPMDPLTADEIIESANILLRGGAARPGAIFQSIELREPSKADVLGFRGGAGTRRSTVFYRQDKKSYKSTVNLTAQTFTPPVLIPRERGPARPDDHRGGRLLVRVPGSGVPERARAARPALAGAAAEGLRHAADAGLVRPARGGAPDRQGADVLHRGRRQQSLRAADRRPAGDHRSRRAPDRQADRHRRRADPGGATTTSTRPASARATAFGPS